MFARVYFLVALGAVFAAPSAPAADGTHDKGFWRAVSKNEGHPPAGLQPRDLAPELVADLASTDSELRDVLAYDILVRWIYQGALTADEVRPLMHTLLGNLRVDLGERDTDSVFRRSYSALILSIVVARNNEQAPFLTTEEFRTLFDAALAYLTGEKDERGFDPQKGWMHSVAHAADLLKFLARDPRLTPADQTRLLDALHAKLRQATGVYACGEDERLARVVISLARREPGPNAVSTWTEIGAWVKAVAADAAFPENATPENLRLTTNSRHLLTSVWAEISVDDRPSAGLDALRPMVRAALKGML